MSLKDSAVLAREACAILMLMLLLLPALHPVQGQTHISDGDDQFEAVHQDIGRISGLSAQGSPKVAPTSALVARVPSKPQYYDRSQLASPPPAAASNASPLSAETVAQVFDRSGAAPRSASRQNSAAQSGSRKPNRITLVARRDPLPSVAGAIATNTGPVASEAAAAALEAPLFATPRFTQSPPQQAEQAGGPALSSFRASVQEAPAAPIVGSVSARHSALMAQVAAERAAAAGLVGGSAPFGLGAHPGAQTAGQQEVGNPGPTGHHAQPSQAVSSFAQAAPNFHLAQNQHQHQHQHQLLAAPTDAQSQSAAQVEVEAAPSFQQVIERGCPQSGVFSWDNKDHCDRYYMCTNGTFTEEACPNGLAYSKQGAVYQHCAYNWNVDCGRKKTAEPIASPGCPWQFGLFPIVQNGRCSIDYFACEWGVPETKRCSPEGLFYDDRIKGCQWADQLGCKSETLLNFKCPPEDEDNPYWPYPRYYHDSKDVIVCVNEQPRLVHCNEDQLVEPSSLACVDINKKKKKF